MTTPAEWNSLLIKSIIDESLLEFEKAIENGANPSAKDENGNPALYLVIANFCHLVNDDESDKQEIDKYMSMIDRLISSGAGINATNAQKVTGLNLAFLLTGMPGIDKVVDVLLKHPSLDLTKYSEGALEEPLYRYHGYVKDTAKTKIAKVKELREQGKTELKEVVKNGNIEKVKEFISAGVAIEVQRDVFKSEKNLDRVYRVNECLKILLKNINYYSEELKVNDVSNNKLNVEENVKEIKEQLKGQFEQEQWNEITNFHAKQLKPGNPNPSDNKSGIEDNEAYYNEPLPVLSRKITTENLADIKLPGLGGGVLLKDCIKKCLEDLMKRSDGKVKISNFNTLDDTIKGFKHVILPDSHLLSDNIDARIRLLTNIDYGEQGCAFINGAFKTSSGNINQYEPDIQNAYGHFNIFRCERAFNDLFLNPKILKVKNIAEGQYQSTSAEQRKNIDQTYLSIGITLVKEQEEDVIQLDHVDSAYSQTTRAAVTSYCSEATKELPKGSITKGVYKAKVSVHKIATFAINKALETLAPWQATKILCKAAEKKMISAFGRDEKQGTTLEDCTVHKGASMSQSQYIYA